MVLSILISLFVAMFDILLISGYLFLFIEFYILYFLFDNHYKNISIIICVTLTSNFNQLNKSLLFLAVFFDLFISNKLLLF
jgi:hypothetical protein